MKDDWPAKVGDFLLCEKHRYHPKTAFMCGNHPNIGFFKDNFRPATPEEIKEQEMKITDEKKAEEARANRWMFIVAGQEFYAGQTVWAEYDLIGVPKGTEIEVVGYDANNVDNLILRHKDRARSFSANPRGRFTTTEPKPHEWKFGDWARNKDGALGMVISYKHNDGNVYFLRKGDVSAKLTDASTLRYISAAEIPE